MAFRWIVLFCFAAAVGFSQADDYALKPPRDYEKNPAKNAAFIELGGNAGLYSLSFDRIYLYREKFKMSGRLGFAPLPHGYYFEQAYVVENCFILFSNPHHLEFSLGATLQRRYNEKPDNSGDYAWENIWFSAWHCGYRYQKQDDGFFLKAGLTPIIMSHDALGFHPGYFQLWGGLAIGMGF